MKIKHLLIGMLAMAAAVACKQDEPVEEPVLEVNKTAVALAATAAEGAFEVTANNAWSADADADWVSLDPANGAGGENAVVVKVTAEDNTAEARTATVTVKSGNLTRTLKVVQAAAAAGPGDGVDPDAPTYILVGDAVGGWNVDQNAVVLTLKDGYYQAKGVAVTAKKGMHFTKNNNWEGNVKGLHGLIAPNEIGEVGNNDISLTEDGLYDVYLTEALDKFYFMTEGKLPSEAVEHKEISTVWGVCGSIDGNAWGAGSDPEMTLEDEWYVAKNITFTQVNFKIRGNNSWADDVKWGTATKNQTCELNKAVAVSTCTEFKDANPGEDNPNIYIAAPAGAYDVYFSPEKKEVWVMTPGYKPGDEIPEAPVQPEKETAQLVTFLSFTSNVASGQNIVTVQLAAEGLSMEPVTSEWGTYDQLVGAGKYLKFDAYSADGTLAAGTYNASAVGGTVNEGEFSIGYDTTVDWGFGPMEMTNWGTCWMTHNADGSETGVKITDGTITVAVEGDVYTITVESSVLEATYVGKLSKDAGETPENPEPEQPELEVSTWALVGSFNGWDAAGSTAFLSVLDADYFVYYGFEAGANTEFKFVKDGKWASQGGAEIGGAIGTAEPNTIQTAGGKNIVIAEAGKYDIYLTSDLSKFYVMTEGKLPAEATEPAPVETTYTVVGTLNGINWSNNAPEGLMTKDGAYYVAKNVPFVTAKTLYGGADQFEFKVVETGTWNGYGVAGGTPAAPANTEIALQENGENIPVTAAEGAYDVYFDKDNAKVWVMEPGLKPGETPAQPEPEYELEGKQWYYSAQGVLVDLGLYEEGAMVIAVPLNDGSGFGAYMYGPYEVEKTDATSGKIIFTQYDPEWDEFMDPVEYPYSELSENLVMIGAEPLTGDPTPLPFVAVEEPYEIVFEEIGGADPVGPIENGQYWFFNGTKVMAPLAEGTTTGTLPAGNVINGASTEKNIFTLMYDPDMSYYTIMDSYGRFLGQTDETGNITVTDVLPTGEDYAYYLWCVETAYGEAVSIYNAAYYYDITYSSANNNWALVDGGYEYPETLPTLVKAENPVEEPTGPQAITVAEFLALSVGTTEYELTGVIEGTYNTTYGNFYLNDGTGKVLVYGLTATPQTSNDKSFASLGLRDGDTLTLIGQRADYNGTAQVGGPAYYVSHIAAPYVDFAVGSATVDAEATTYSIEFESNVAWTATASAGVTVNPASGEGDGTVVMTFAANTSNDPIDHTVTFTATDLTKTFTLTQKGVPAEGAEPMYVKVTEEQTDWSGKYLIVFGNNAHATLSGKDLIATKAVNPVAGEIEATSDLDAAVMTVSKNGDKYVMTYPDGKYFSMAKNSSSSSTTAFDLTFTYTANGVKIAGVASGTTYILYHNSSNGNYYRCYVDKNGQSGYNLPTLYKYTE